MTPELPKADSLAKRTYHYLKSFLKIEADSGIILLIFTALALILANSVVADSYYQLWHKIFLVKIFKLEFSWSLHFFINEVLMTLFFLSVGLEIRAEIYDGSLSNFKQALLPVVAAVGGVLMPALIFFTINKDPKLLHGWATPTATDIAFAVGVLSLLKRFIPSTLKVFLLTLAIIDDIIAIVIIAIFYSAGINFNGLLIATLGIAITQALRIFKVNHGYTYILSGIIIWYGLFIGNIHPTLSGVILGLMMPVEPFYLERNSLLEAKAYELSIANKLQNKLHPSVAYIIVPLFVLANAGISIGNLDFYETESYMLIISIIIAFVIGKPLGIVSISMLAVWINLCKLPKNIKWQHIILVGLLAGIGFTMAIFIAMLSFDSNMKLLNASKFAILIGSLVASILGLTWGMIISKRA